MKQYIDKSVLVEEIKKRLLPVNRDKHYDEWEEGQDNERIAILGIIDTFKVKEVDLGQEIKNRIDSLCNLYCYMEDLFDGKEEEGVYPIPEKVMNELFEFAKYFYELGINAKVVDANLWKSADGEDLPEIDREVIVLYQPYPLENSEYYAVGFGHRPREYWDGKNISTGEVTRYYPKKYDKGGWNSPNIKWWLDLKLPINEEE